MKRYLTQLVCLILITAVPGFGYGSVLCYGQDGHVAIEPALHSHCHDHDEHDAASDHDHGHDMVISSSDTCSPCVDFLVERDSEPVRVKNALLWDSAAGTLGLSVHVSHLNHLNTTKECDSFSFFSPLKSIVLLT